MCKLWQSFPVFWAKYREEAIHEKGKDQTNSR